jgi:hypothetical protein
MLQFFERTMPIFNWQAKAGFMQNPGMNKHRLFPMHVESVEFSPLQTRAATSIRKYSGQNGTILVTLLTNINMRYKRIEQGRMNYLLYA